MTCPICNSAVVRTGIIIECDSPTGRERIRREVVECTRAPDYAALPLPADGSACFWIAALEVKDYVC